MTTASYEDHGVSFDYPADWGVTEQRDEGLLTITVASPETSFWVLSIFFDQPAAEDVMDTVLEEFESEYEDVDVYPVDDAVCGQETLARDIEFVCLELLNTARARVFQAGGVTALVLYQGFDDELESTDRLMQAMTASLHCHAVEFSVDDDARDDLSADG